MLKSFKITKDLELFMCIAFFSVSNFSRLLELFGIPRIAIYVVYTLINLLYFIKYLKRIRYIDVAYYILVLPIVIIGLMKNYSYINSIASVASVVLLFIPSFLFFRIVKINKLQKGFDYSMYFAAIYLMFFYFFQVRSHVAYSMSYAYWVASPICYLFYKYSINKKKINLVISLCLFITLILVGCRGALLLTILCIIFLYLFCSNEKKSKRTVRWCAVCGVFSILLINIDRVFLILEKYSNTSRNIRKLISGNFFDASTRNSIYELCKKYIEDNPMGYGCLSSRRLLIGHNYPHSFFYEMQLDFGKYIGTIIAVFVIILALYLLWKNRQSQMGAFIAILVIISFFSLFLSSSVYYDYTVPAILAIGYRILKNNYSIIRSE